MRTLVNETTKKNLAPTKGSRVLLIGVILFSWIGVDQLTKQIAIEHLQGEEPKIYLSGSLRIQYAENPGAFLGVGGELSDEVRQQLLVGFNGVLLLFVVGLLVFQWSMPSGKFISLSMILAGGIGNLIDRVTQQGMVTDFINLGVGPVRTGIFNVADVAISIGVVWFLWITWFEGQEEKKQTEKAETTSEPVTQTATDTQTETD